MTKVKFCGIRRVQDLIKACELNVDYVGFILYPKSKRYVSFKELEELLPFAKGVKRVSVLVNPNYENVKKALDRGIDLIQLHGEESFEFAKKVGLGRVIKAFRVKESLKIQEEWRGVYAVLLDTHSGEAYGGTGKTFDWSIARNVVEGGFRVFLSGGLNSENVKEAIDYVRPYAVDVSSGIEISPGVKDHEKMERFLRVLTTSTMNS
ncbi:MAG: phosphoribosylanthranilate isomerase [Aquificaceae bacterium]